MATMRIATLVVTGRNYGSHAHGNTDAVAAAAVINGARSAVALRSPKSPLSPPDHKHPGMSPLSRSKHASTATSAPVILLPTKCRPEDAAPAPPLAGSSGLPSQLCKTSSLGRTWSRKYAALAASSAAPDKVPSPDKAYQSDDTRPCVISSASAASMSTKERCFKERDECQPAASAKYRMIGPGCWRRKGGSPSRSRTSSTGARTGKGRPSVAADFANAAVSSKVTLHPFVCMYRSVLRKPIAWPLAGRYLNVSSIGSSEQSNRVVKNVKLCRLGGHACLSSFKLCSRSRREETS